MKANSIEELKARAAPIVARYAKARKEALQCMKEILALVWYEQTDEELLAGAKDTDDDPASFFGDPRNEDDLMQMICEEYAEYPRAD